MLLVIEESEQVRIIKVSLPLEGRKLLEGYDVQTLRSNKTFADDLSSPNQPSYLEKNRAPVTRR